MLAEIENLRVFFVVLESLQQGSVAVTVGKSVLVWGGVVWSDWTSEVSAIRNQMKVFQTLNINKFKTLFHNFKIVNIYV